MPQKITDWERIPSSKITDWESVSNQTDTDPDSNILREASWPEWGIGQALSILPPIGAAVLASETGPLGMWAAGTAAGGAGEWAKEEFEKWRGIRREINPAQIGVQGVLSGIPLGGKAPGVGATAEEVMKHAWQAPFKGAAKGFIIGAGGHIPSSLAEGETPTMGGMMQSGVGSALFGAGGAAAFDTVPSIRRANRLRAIADVPPPSPMSEEFNQRIPLDPVRPGTPEEPILPFYPEQPPSPPPTIPPGQAPPPGPMSNTSPRVISLQNPTPPLVNQMRMRGYEVWEGHTNANGDMQMIRRDQLSPDARVQPLPQEEEFSLTGQSMDDLSRESDIRSASMARAREIAQEQGISIEEAHARAIDEYKRNAFIEQVTPELGPVARPIPPPITPEAPPTIEPTVNPGATELVQRVSKRVQEIMAAKGVDAATARQMAATEYAQSIIKSQPTTQSPVNLDFPTNENGIHEQQQPSAANNAMLKAAGFEPMGQLSVGGKPLWRQTGVVKPKAPPAPNQIPAMGDTVPYHPDDNVIIEESKVNKIFLKNMEADGMYPIGNDGKGNIVFERRDPEIDLPDESRREFNDLERSQNTSITNPTARGLPKIRTETDIKGHTRVWINDQEYTGNFGPGGPSDQDIIRLHSQVRNPESWIRLEQLKAEQAGTTLDSITAVPPRGRGIEEGSGVKNIDDIPQESRKSGQFADATDMELYELRTRLAEDYDMWNTAAMSDKSGIISKHANTVRKKLDAVTKELSARRGDISASIIDENEHPIVQKFRAGLKTVNDINKAYFILPDGAMIGDINGSTSKIHAQLAREVGVDLPDAIAAGIVRYRHGGAEIYTPITSSQAKSLTDAFLHHDTLYLDVFNHANGKGEFSTKSFHARSSAEGIQNWVNAHFDENSVRTAIETKRRVAKIQKQYDSIAPLQGNVHYLDEGNRLTPEELSVIQSNPVMTRGIAAIERLNQAILNIADGLGWKPVSPVAIWKLPSQRLKKFGLLFMGPDARGVTFGIHIPHPVDVNESAIMINLMEHLNDAANTTNPTGMLVGNLLDTLGHEQAHIPGGGHGDDFSLRDSQLTGRITKDKRLIPLINAVEEAFGDGRGNLSPELSEALRVYNESRGRRGGEAQTLLQTGIAQQRPPNQAAGQTASDGSTPTGKGKPRSIGREILNFPRAATTPLDLSAAMRQGLPLIGTKAWWSAWKQQVAALKSEGAYQKTLADIRKRPLFQQRRDMNPDSPTFGKKVKSYADQAGMKVSDVADISTREESVASTWIETGEMFGKGTALQKGYKAILGDPIRATNRAYTAFLNQLRADTFESLINDAVRDFKSGVKGAKDPMTDLKFAKEIADYVNTATGKGPMRLARPTIEGGKLGLKESNLEQNAQLLTDTLFAPRLFFSRARMLNPMTYMMATPFVRKQYLKSALSVAGAWGTISTLGYMAGKSGIADVDVSLDPNSADFGKMRIGNTRLDPAGGFQQYLVALSRLISGRTTSSKTGRDAELGAGYQADTRKDIAERFMVNKLNPVVKFAWDLIDASQYQPFHVADRTAQLFVPLIIQDVIELSKEDPSLLPLIAPIALGMGSQTYDKGESAGKIIPPENDWILKGGDVREMSEEDILPDWAQEIQ